MYYVISTQMYDADPHRNYRKKSDKIQDYYV